MKIVIIGSGNVAWQLAVAFRKAGHEITEVLARNGREAYKLSLRVKAPLLMNLKFMEQEADVYLIAVSDEAIKYVLSRLYLRNQLVVHTSGSTGLNVFGKQYPNCGVFYPVQTISKKTKINFKNTPVGIEASNKKSLRTLELLSKSISGKTHVINSKQRSALHLAAVFANNFTNHMYAAAHKILKDNKLPFELLFPLIAETVRKIRHNNPSGIQTGPAVRKDQHTMQKHLAMLKKYPEYQKIYKNISKSIQKK